MTVVIADDGLLGLAELAPADWTVRWYSGRDIPPNLLNGASALLIRSTTRIIADTLPKTVKFIGTATIGTDHLPLADLGKRGIEVVSAPGCNAFAVTDYVLSQLLNWAKFRGRSLEQLTLGIIGVGAVGSLLEVRSSLLGIRCLVSDQPRYDRCNLPQHLPPLDLIRQSDVVSLHVPLLSKGPYRTERFLDSSALVEFSNNSLLINASRGPVLHEYDLLSNPQFDLVLDVFPNEPVISDSLINRSWRISPHVAGHSAEGKLRGTKQIVRVLADLTGASMNPLNEEAFLNSVAGQRYAGGALAERIRKSCSIAETDRLLREMFINAFERERPNLFDQVRHSYLLRRESEFFPL